MAILIGGAQTNSTATPIVVAIPGAIVSNPQGNQTVTQPVGTTLSINNLTVTGTFIGSVPSSTNILGGSAGAVPYQSSTGTTAFVASPTAASHTYFLSWQPLGSTIPPTAYDATNLINSSITSATAPLNLSAGVLSCSSCLTTATIYYQTMYNGLTLLPQEPASQFGTEFTLGTSSGKTTVDIANSGVTAGTYTNPSSITVDQFGRTTAISSGSGGPTDYYWTSANTCSTGTGQPVHCTTTTTLPGNMPDASYQLTCQVAVQSYSGAPPSGTCALHDNYPLPTSSGATITYDAVQIMQNGGGGGVWTAYFHAHHN